MERETTQDESGRAQEKDEGAREGVRRGWQSGREGAGGAARVVKERDRAKRGERVQEGTRERERARGGRKMVREGEEV